MPASPTLKNGSSVIVRVNDRGPYSHDRLIDLSKRAADMLDYTAQRHRQGEGRICRPRAAGRPRRPVSHGLLPSRQSGARSVGRPADRRHDRDERRRRQAPTSAAPAVAFPGTLIGCADGRSRPSCGDVVDLALPAFGPIAPERPAFDSCRSDCVRLRLAVLCRARRPGAHRLLPRSNGRRMTATTSPQSWKRHESGAHPSRSGLYRRRLVHRAAEAERLAAISAGFGATALEKSEIDGTAWYTVNLYADGRNWLRRPAGSRLGERRARRDDRSRLTARQLFQQALACFEQSGR